MKIFVDFDDSLFNTKKFRDDLLDVFLKNGVSRRDFLDTYYDYPQRTSHGLKKYDPVRQIEMLVKVLTVNKNKLKKDLNKFIQNTKKYVFADAIDFLGDFSKKDLYLISFGYTNFQFKKIKNSGLYATFKKVIIADSNKNIIVKNFVRRKENIIFIDDRIENINNIKKHFPAGITFLLKRKEGRYNDKKTKYVDYEIKNLTAAEKIIKKIFAKERKKT